MTDFVFSGSTDIEDFAEAFKREIEIIKVCPEEDAVLIRLPRRFVFRVMSIDPSKNYRRKYYNYLFEDYRTDPAAGTATWSVYFDGDQEDELCPDVAVGGWWAPETKEACETIAGWFTRCGFSVRVEDWNLDLPAEDEETEEEEEEETD